jgi:hypothetical protein
MSEKEILGLEDKRFGAMIKGDFKALDAMVTSPAARRSRLRSAASRAALSCSSSTPGRRPQGGNSSPGNRRRCRLERRLFGQARRRPPADRQKALYRRLEPAGTALRVLPALRQGARRPRGQGSKGH